MRAGSSASSLLSAPGALRASALPLAAIRLDAIEPGTGIAPDKVCLTRTGEELIIGLIGTNDTLRVQYYLYQDGASPYAVDQIRFVDGTAWDVAPVKVRMQAGSRSGASDSASAPGVSQLVNAMAAFVPAPASQSALPGMRGSP